MSIPTKEALFPKDIKDKVCGCVYLLFIVNPITYAVSKELTLANIVQYFVPISTIALFGLITWYLVYGSRVQVLRLWYFWLFPFAAFFIGIYAFYIRNLPPPTPENLLVVIANFEPIPRDDEDAKSHSETVPEDLNRKIGKKKDSGVPLEYPKRYKDVIKGDDEEAKKENAKKICKNKYGAHLVLWGNVQVTKLGEKGEFCLYPKISFARPLGQNEKKDRNLSEMTVPLSNPDFLELREHKLDEIVDIVLAFAEYNKQNFQDAIKFFEMIREPIAEVSIYHGSALRSLDHFDKAIEQFNKAIKMNPKLAAAWSNKGFVLERLGKHDEAKTCYDEAIKINPSNAEVWNNKGVILYKSGKYEDAIKCYNKAIEINPSFTAALSNKGLALDESGKHDEAIIFYDEALKINPSDGEIWSNRGTALFNSRRYKEAILNFNKAIEINPSDAIPWSNKGDALNKIGKYEEALTHSNKAIEIDPQYAPAQFNKGESLENLGRTKEAIDAYGKFIELSPQQYFKYVPQAKVRIQALQEKINK